MKRLVIGAALAGSAAYALRPLFRKAHQMHEHCREMIARRQQPEPTPSAGTGS